MRSKLRNLCEMTNYLPTQQSYVVNKFKRENLFARNFFGGKHFAKFDKLFSPQNNGRYDNDNQIIV